jgi:hypothetical protein
MDSFLLNSDGSSPNINSRRRLANALLMSGMNTAPVQSWTQGLARVAQALVAKDMMSDEDAKEKQATDLLLNNPMLGGAGAQGGATPVASPAPAPQIQPGPVVPNDDNAIPGTAGMNQSLADRSQDFIQDNPGTYMSSGVRSTADQARLYADRGNNPNPVAPPGTSLHERGLAVDIGGMSPDQRALLPQYGLGQPVANDPPHVELARPAMQVAGNDPRALPVNAQPTQGYGLSGQGASAAPQVPPAMAGYIRNLIANPLTRGTGVQLLQQYAKPREMHSQETDASGNVWDVNQLTGQRTVALKKDKPDTLPTSVQEYNYYKSTLPDGAQPMDYSTWSTAKARAGASAVTVNNGGGSDKQIFDAFDERTKEARAAATGLVALRNARTALQGDGGNITGFRANERLALQKAGAFLGLTNPEAIQNTETFRSAIAPQIAATLKATVGTNQISNSDRDFAEKAAGGSITLDEGSINRLLNIMERASVARLQEHQEQLDAVYPDPVANRRERALFGIKVPTSAAPPSGATKSGIKWSVE